MKTSVKILAGVAVLVVAASAFAMSDLLVYGTWRYKITVTVETPEGIKTGSAVRELSNSASSVKLALPEGTNAAKIKGEAVVVDLGKRGTLFALISDTSDDEFYQVFPVPGGGPTSAAGIRYYDGLKAGTKGVLDSSRYPGYPQFVTFKDMNDPKSVTLVYGGRFDAATQTVVPVNDFEAIFGKGVKLKGIRIEATDEPVTWQIEKVLGWLEKVKGGYLDGQFAGGGPDLSNILHGGNFRTGDLK
jgi:hypothetical protein